MKFIDFFKKIKAKYKIEDSKQESKKVVFNELEDWTIEKRREIEDREKEILVLIKNKISEFVKNLDEKIIVLKEIDLSDKKAEDRIKSIVKESLDKYMGSLENFKEDLIKLEQEKLEEFVIKINEVFLSFEKKSNKNYQKANFLIGEEITATKNSIVYLSKYLTRILNENKDIIEVLKIISFTKLKLKQVNEIDETLKRTDERIRFLDEKIENLNKNNKEILERMDEIKKSENYLSNLRQKEEIKLSEKELENEIYRLKAMIDFKALANFFHAFEYQMNMVKVYKEKFEVEFQKDNGSNILSLLNESKLNNEIITSKITRINNKKEEIAKNKEIIKEDETSNLLDKIGISKTEVEKLNVEKIKDQKRSEKLKTNREEIINSLREELLKISVEVS